MMTVMPSSPNLCVFLTPQNQNKNIKWHKAMHKHPTLDLCCFSHRGVIVRHKNSREEPDSAIYCPGSPAGLSPRRLPPHLVVNHHHVVAVGAQPRVHGLADAADLVQRGSVVVRPAEVQHLREARGRSSDPRSHSRGKTRQEKN